MKILPVSDHFTTTSLAEGIFAVIAREGGAAISNAGLVDLGGKVIVFDTFLTLQAARDLRSFSEAVFGQPPRIVINSHYHNDHIWGNQVFLPEAQIISTNRTYQLITTAGQEEYDWYSKNSAQRLNNLQSQMLEIEDEQQMRQLKLWLGYYSGLLETLPSLEIGLPGITFDHDLELHGTRRTARLIDFKGAHTGSDTILHLTQEGIIFVGDVLFVDTHPYFADGDPFLLLNVLRELSQSGANRFIPGHGPVGKLEDLTQMIHYIEHCLDTALALLKLDGSLEDLVNKLEIPDEFKHWELPQFYSSNIRFLCQGLDSE